MRRTIRGGLVALGVGLGVALAPGARPLAGQQGAVVAPAQRGWLGIRYHLEVRRPPGAGGSPAYAMVIADVREDSPAARGGILAGDTVLRIDGRPVAEESLAALRGLEPGERVRLTLRRGGRAVTRDVVAGRRPAAVAPNVSIHLDSMRRAIVAEMDSVQVEIRRGHVALARALEARAGVYADSVLATAPGRDFHVRADSIHVRVLRDAPVWNAFVHPVEPGEAVPLEVFLFHSQKADSLRREMSHLQRELRRVAEAEERRLREMARARSEIDQSDARLRALREQEARLQVELARMGREMVRVRADARRRETERLQRMAEERAEMMERSRTVAERSARMAQEARAAFRPLSIYEVGRNMLAGARLTDLNPALAEYFEVERGVLVTEVVEGTPAAQAPLVAGDVVVRVGEVAVDDLADLRAALQGSSGETSLTVVRKGRRVTVTLPRE